jgi:hypothetical protein
MEGLRPAVESACGRVRDLLPLQIDLAASGSTRALAPSIEEHLSGCAECRSEADLVLRLRSARRDPPPVLLRAILDRLAEMPLAESATSESMVAAGGATAPRPHLGSHRGPRRGWAWALPAAAGVVVAIAIASLRAGGSSPDAVWSLALEPEAPLHWYGDDWVVAGEPLLDALPDEVLRALLEEMTP